MITLCWNVCHCQGGTFHCFTTSVAIKYHTFLDFDSFQPICMLFPIQERRYTFHRTMKGLSPGWIRLGRAGKHDISHHSQNIHDYNRVRNITAEQSWNTWHISPPLDRHRKLITKRVRKQNWPLELLISKLRNNKIWKLRNHSQKNHSHSPDFLEP